jgi:hypothetical protein
MRILQRECQLCGSVDRDVRPAVVRWRDGSFEAVQRCADRDACYRRFEIAKVQGEEWPVVEGVKP